jgi:hypothetical protein
MATHRIDTLRFARVLRGQGLHAAAAEVLEAALQQAGDEAAAAQWGWLWLERADLAAELGQEPVASDAASRALGLFEQAGDGGGAAAAWLALGDLAMATGEGGRAAQCWSRARSLADGVGADPLAARSLMALALHELAQGEADVAQSLLDAAHARAADPPTTAAGEADPAASQRWALQVSLAAVRARHAIRAQRWPEARLLLASAVDGARKAHEPGLMIDCLRTDAVLARRCGDPEAAVAGLGAAVGWAQRAGALRMVWLLRAEQAIAAVDAGDGILAAELLREEPPAEVAALPAIAAARAEAAAVWAAHSGDHVAAGRAWSHAVAVRQQAGDDVGRCRAGAALAESRRRAGDSAGALTEAQRAKDLADRLQRPDLAILPSLVLASVAADGSGVSPSGAAAMVDAAARDGSVAEQLAALSLAVRAHQAVADTAAAQAVADQAVALAEAQPLSRHRARAHALRAAVLAHAAPPADALAAAQHAQTLAIAAADPEASAQALLAAAEILARGGRIDEARLAWSHAAMTARSAMRRDLAVAAQLASAESLMQSGDAAAAETGFLAALQDAGAHGAGLPVVAARRGLAWCRRAEGDLAAALRWSREALAAAEALGHGDLQWACRTDLAELAMQQGQPEAALALGAAPAVAEASPRTRGEALRVAAQAAAIRGNYELAQRWIVQAEADLRRTSADRALGAVLTLAGQIHAARGDGEAAGRALGEALILTTRLGLPEQALVRTILQRISGQAAPAV